MAKCRVDQLYLGQRVDLENDAIADPYGAIEREEDAEMFSAHPEFQYEFEEVRDMQRESHDCIRVDFRSGFSCGFPPDHEIEVDGGQERERR